MLAGNGGVYILHTIAGAERALGEGRQSNIVCLFPLSFRLSLGACSVDYYALMQLCVLQNPCVRKGTIKEMFSVLRRNK